MEQASSAFSTGVPALAAISQLAGNSRQGFGAVASTTHWASGFVISSNTLGLSVPLYDGRVASCSTGKERDAESGNDYFKYRYYASSMGRWLSPDWAAKEDPVPYATFDDPQSLNLYAYVRNNPLSRMDGDGHWDCSGANANGVGCQALAAIHAAQGFVSSAANSASTAINSAVTTARKNIDQAGGRLTGRGEFNLTNSDDRAALAKLANTAASIIVPALFSGGESLEGEAGELGAVEEGNTLLGKSFASEEQMGDVARGKVLR